MPPANHVLQRALSEAKWAFTTRRVAQAEVRGLRADLTGAVSGDLVLGEIVRLGQHRKVQLASGRYSESYLGDLVVLACGDRYAPDQFEGTAELGAESADILAGGGVLGKMRHAHDAMSKPTRVRPLGLLTDAAGAVINVARYALPQGAMPDDIAVVVVTGASMNAGKTTAAASLAHGLGKAGWRVAGIKATGTGAFGDFNAFRDAGVPIVADFTDAGMASTYRQPPERIEQGLADLLAHAAAQGAEIAVVELADGVLQEETARLLRSPRLRRVMAGVLFATPDAIGAVGGVALLRDMELEPFAVSGPISRSPLAAAEAEAATRVPVVRRAELRDPERAAELTTGLLPMARAWQRKVA